MSHGEFSSWQHGKVPTQSIHVLYVVDDESRARTFSQYIDAECPGFGVTVVTTITGALDALNRNGTIDCVVSEAQVGEGTGADLLAEIRARSATPFVLFTTPGEEEEAVRVMSTGVTETVLEQGGNAQFAILVNRIRNLVAQYRATVELSTTRTATQFHLLVESVEDYAIFLLDEEGFIQTWNRGAEAIKGYSAAEVVGEHISIFYTPEDVEAGVPERNLRIAEENGRFATEGWRVRKNGDEFWADVVITPLRENGRLVGFAKVTRDVTDRMKAAELRSQNAFLHEFAGTVSHDLLNPLTVAQANVHLCMQTGDTERLETVDTALSRMRQLIDDLLELAQKGERISDPEPTDLRAVATDAWETTATENGSLEFHENAVVEADETRLRQLFENLFRNAAAHGGSSVTIRVGAQNDGFYVEDDGPGISAETKKRVFDMHFSTREEGSGFGLAIVHQIATAHGWSVTLMESAAGGVRFEFSGVERCDQ
ncbi:PAS domain S-box protein [Haloarchaeobius sp. DFWS5]|uniref:PAS domain S-box protein n=1 Tax=Haloarchaeobius sp. DFWS5 TaxID=3446114 RepID=UPI003EB91027